MYNSLEKEFEKRFSNPKRIFNIFCPYRVCPLGAHIDHQNGKVNGFAIDKGMEMCFDVTEDGSVELESLNKPGRVEFNVNSCNSIKRGDWGDYPIGATRAIVRHRKLTKGVRGVIYGSLPIGGLSSSAALTVVFIHALSIANEIVLDPQDVINSALWAENVHVGVNCGKLDQSCVVRCKKDNLLYLDNLDDSFTLIPKAKDCKPFEIAVFFSGVPRDMRQSAFNVRVSEMRSAAYALKAYAGMEYADIDTTHMREVPRSVFEEYKDRLPDAWRLRATHYYTEMERVESGVKLWEKGDIEGYGKLIFESGESSVYNYQTGSEQLIKLYEIMHRTDGIYGGRFSGAGFKGCCMALIDPAFKDVIIKNVTREYLAAFPELKGDYSVHICQTADGCGG